MNCFPYFYITTQIHRKIKELTSNERKPPKKNKDQHKRKSLQSPNESKHDKDKPTTRHHKTKGMGSKKQNCQSLNTNFSFLKYIPYSSNTTILLF